KRVQENMPYDQIVKGVLTATSREGKSPDDWLAQVVKVDDAAAKGFEWEYANRDTLDLFWRRQQNNIPIEQWGEKTAAAFMGVRPSSGSRGSRTIARTSMTGWCSPTIRTSPAASSIASGDITSVSASSIRSMIFRSAIPRRTTSCSTLSPRSSSIPSSISATW